MVRTLAVVLLLTAAARPVAAEDTPKPKAPADALQGRWLFDAAALGKHSELPRVWGSAVAVTGDGFALSKLMGAKGDLKGKLRFDPADASAVDLVVSELDLSELLPGYKVPAGTLRAIYRLDGDRLTLCFPHEYAGKRPVKFEATAGQFLATLARAPKGFTDVPREVTLTVTGADGKPAPGAAVGGFMHNTRLDPAKPGAPPRGWELSDPVTTGADGTATLKTEAVRAGALVVRDAAGTGMAVVPVSPAKLAAGGLRGTLQPHARITAAVTCAELTKAGEPLGHVNAYLIAGGARIALWSSKDGALEFLAPPGGYTLHVYGPSVETRNVDVVVPAGRAEVRLDPIEMPALAFALLKGKTAPELDGVVGWAGPKTTFADLKGKYVLVEFWGYWCGPCIGSMPTLIALHEEYADKGLAIVGVHVDLAGEVDTAEKLAAKIKGFEKEYWKGKPLPFPSALASGARSGEDARHTGPVAQYGVRGLPTCLLLYRDGKLVGQFNARDLKAARAELDRLLGPKK